MSFRLEAPFVALYHPARAFLLRRGLYLLLAFDAWLVMLEHGGRYGAGDFNVAHFSWLDALVGVPSPALYVGLLICAGLLSLILTFVRASRPARLLLAGLYTFSWAISLHDSYQHHYLLSWLLLWAAFVPEPASHELVEDQPAPVRAVGLTLTAFSCAIVYSFTAVSKSSPEWRSGAVLARLIPAGKEGAQNPVAQLRDWASSLLEMPAQRILAWFSLSLLVLQLVVALAYAVSPGRDQAGVRGPRAWICGVGLAAAVAFHLGTELTGVFEIGWFSYYMLWVSCVLLAPSAWLAWPTRRLARALLPLGRLLVDENGPAAPWWLYAVALSGLMLACGVGLDLPGAIVACGATSLWLVAVLAGRHVRSEAGAPERWALSAVVACASLWCALTLTPVRFDFYRRWAGEISRLGQTAQALTLYRKAEKYAPPGASRARQIEFLERQLGK
ncbi:MAG: hypothetical protein QM778_13455 [Myxococcales bacterium]